MNLSNLKNQNKGNAWVGLLMLMVFVAAIGLSLLAEVTLTIVQAKRSSLVIAAQALCDAGIEKTIWNLNKGTSYSGEAMETGLVEVSVTDGAQAKDVIATAYVPFNTNAETTKQKAKVTRRVRVRLEATPNEQGIAFKYAIQSGAGGIHIQGSAEVAGNLYSNGVVDFTGNGHKITGDVMAHTTVTPNPNPKINGKVTEGVPQVPLPYVNVDAWRDYAERGGTHLGDYSPAGTVNLGPKVITEDVTLNNNGQSITLTGPLYIQGNLNMSGGNFKLAESFGTKGTVIIVDGKVGISGGGRFLSNSAGGFILVVSLSTAADAITYGGSSQSEALAMFALKGGMNITGGGEIVATCGETLNLSGTGEIKYKSGLANANFSAGPGGSWEIKEWQILKNL